MYVAIVSKVALCLKAGRDNVVVFQSKYTTIVTFTKAK